MAGGEDAIWDGGGGGGGWVGKAQHPSQKSLMLDRQSAQTLWRVRSLFLSNRRTGNKSHD